MQRRGADSHDIFCCCLPAVAGLTSGVLLLSGRYVALATGMLAPIPVNILAFHITRELVMIAPAILAILLWLVVAYDARGNFYDVFRANVRRYAALDSRGRAA
jgi:hypothetical protein